MNGNPDDMVTESEGSSQMTERSHHEASISSFQLNSNANYS
jgi:hypothetical protein